MARIRRGTQSAASDGARTLGAAVVHPITNDADARQVARLVGSKGIPFIKVWVTNRGGTQRKTTPEAYRALIDEAHTSGIRVVAHATDGLEDAKDLARAGLDGFIQGVLDANPLDDITNTRTIAAVYLQGKAIDRGALKKRWNPAAMQ